MPSIINRRGRPPYPDILTPAEWQVLEGVRAGLTNQEIADRLGVTFHTVKYHISNMLSKLHLEDRQQLAVWRPSAGERPGRRWPRFSLAPLGALRVAATAGGGVALASSLGLVSILAIRGIFADDSPTESSVTATPSIVPASTPYDVAATLPQSSPGVTAGILDRGRTFTRLTMSAVLAEPLPEGIVPSAGGDLTILAYTPRGTRAISDRSRDYQKAYDPTTWITSIDADPLPQDTLAVEIRVEKITLIIPGTDTLPTIIGPWIGVTLVADAPPLAIDLSSRLPRRIDTGYGWAYVIDGVERVGDSLAVTYHAEGTDLNLLQPERRLSTPSDAMLSFVGARPTTVSVPISPGASSLEVHFGAVRRLESTFASYESGSPESGDWSIKIPLD